MSAWIIGIISICCALLLGHWAEKRGSSRFFWVLMGALFGPLAVPFFFLGRKKPDPE